MSMRLLISEIAEIIGCPTPLTEAVVTGAVIDSRK